MAKSKHACGEYSLDDKVDSMSNRYVITSGQYNSSVNHKFYNSLLTYCESNNAELLVLPMRGSRIMDDILSDYLQQHKIITRDYKLNEKVRISNYEILPQMIDPITGLARITQSDVSTIFASPKQRLKVVPNSNVKLPKVLMTTGAVTNPNYRENRIGKIAAKDHTYGAAVVEVTDSNTYHYRHISSLKNGIFYDLGVKYDDNKNPKTERPEALILGDWHVGDTNGKVRKETFKMIEEYNPKRLILHDFFTGYSISHHEQGKIITLAKKYKKLSLDDELRKAAHELKNIVEVTSPDTEIVIVKSNHDEWINHYLQDGRFIKEPQNTKVGSELLLQVLDGEDALRAGIVRHYENIPSKVRFLSRDEDYKVRGWQLGSHGDKGASGTRASIRSLEYALGKSITGHTHTPEIFRNVWKVGTSTNLKLSYNEGFSGWMNTHALLYKNARAQLVNIIKGKHKLWDFKGSLK